MQHGKIADVMEIVYMLDQTLEGVGRGEAGAGGEAWVVLVREMQAQLFFHAGSLLFKKAKQVSDRRRCTTLVPAPVLFRGH